MVCSGKTYVIWPEVTSRIPGPSPRQVLVGGARGGPHRVNVERVSGSAVFETTGAEGVQVQNPDYIPHQRGYTEAMTQKKGYGQFCPVAKASEILAERWTPLVVRELLHGSHRFNDLRRGVPLMSASLLSRRLKESEWVGVVERRQVSGEPGNHYYLTEAGQALRPVIEALGPQDLDPGLLMWDIRRWLRTEYLPPGRIVARFEFPEQPANKRRWWLLKDREEPDLCLQDPGFGVGLTVSADLHTMTRIWLGDLGIEDALRMHTLRLAGSTALRLSFHGWIGLSPFVHMQEPSLPPGT
jgi:DNA-binding HxlR family transcriptional regulator